MLSKFVLQAENISKSFPGVKALDNMQLFLERGKVHALMGENGAGKSTFMNIISGMDKPDSGSIYLNGHLIKFLSVTHALRLGISMIHQELLPFPELSVAENIFIGNVPKSKIPFYFNRSKINEQAASLLDKLGAKINVTRKMKELSIAEMQMVEIAKALFNNVQVVIMDEPSSSLSDREVSNLFSIIKDLKNKGIAIVYISHKMDEILQIADTITVMRDGKFIASSDKSEMDNEKLISMIVGRELKGVFDKPSINKGEVILEVKNLCGEKFNNINFKLRKGEILGIAGLMGAGRTEIVNALFGLEKISGGEIILKNKKVRIRNTRQALRNGIGLVSEDRKKHGLVLKLSVKANITLSTLKKCSVGPFIDFKKEKNIVDEQIKNLRIRTPSRNQLVNYLSGGNQQKIVLSKVLLNDCDVIILDEPTKGIDIGAKADIYKLMNKMALEGKAIIMISSELPEILGMADRILVIHEGELKADLDKSTATQESIMKYAMD